MATFRALTSVAILALIGSATSSLRSAESHDVGANVPPNVVSRTLLLDAAFAGNVVVAVGERGTILRSEDAARSWTPAQSLATATLTGVAFADAATGWAVGHDGLILGTHDGGRSWVKQWQSENFQDSFLDVAALDGRQIIAIGAYGLFVSTNDGGTTWTRRKIIDEDYHFNRIVVRRDRATIAGSNSGMAAGSGDTALQLFIAGEHGTLLRSGDSGESWQPLHVPYEGSLYGVLPLPGHGLLAYGLRGRVFHSTDDGENWQPVSTNASWLIATGIRLENSTIVLAGNGRTLLVSSDPRRDFFERDVGAPAAIAELLVLPDGDLLAVGEAGVERIERSRVLPHVPPRPEASK